MLKAPHPHQRAEAPDWQGKEPKRSFGDTALAFPSSSLVYPEKKEIR